jgi:Na+/H+ antiporter NhaD/arsenite permease-like protein
MNIFYENLPFPIFIGITFVVPVLILFYFYKKKSDYPTVFLIGMIFLCLTAFAAGIVRVLREFQMYNKYAHLFGAIPIPFIILTIPFIMVGAYQKVKDNEGKRRKILFFSLILFFIVLFFVLLSIFKPWE